MDDKIFFEDQTAKIYYNEQLDTLFLEYKGKLSNHEHFVEINTKVKDAFLGLQTRKFVADIRFMGILGIESQAWVAEVLLPAMIGHLNGKDLYHAQYLDEKDVFAKVSGSGVKNKSESKLEGFVLEQFSDFDKLKSRLLSIS